jgi:hypothetical protein
VVVAIGQRYAADFAAFGGARMVGPPLGCIRDWDVMSRSPGCLMVLAGVACVKGAFGVAGAIFDP